MKPHLLHVFATFAAGGPQVRTTHILNALGPDWRHSILPMDGRSEARDLLAPELDVELLDAPQAGNSLATVRSLARRMRALRPDLLLTYNWGAIEALWAGRWARVGSILHHEDGFRPDELGGFKRRRVLARRLTLRSARAVIVPSHTLERIATELWKLAPEHVQRVPNGIRLEDFPPRDGNAELRGELGIPPEAVVVGSVGHLRGEKNPVRLVQAIAAARSRPHLLMLGDGDERGAVEAAVERHGLAERVHLVGHRERTAPCYRAMDLFALSSDTEQMPVALLEAMAAGLPAVSTDVGDVRRMLSEENAGAVVPAGERAHEALAEEIDRLAEDASLRAELGRANRERVRADYSFEGMLAAYRQLYEAGLPTPAPVSV